MPISLETWLAYEEEFRSFGDRIASVHADWDGDATDALNRLHSDRQKLIARASTALPARGPVAAWMNAAVDEFGPEPTPRAEFALRVLSHRKQFPKAYLRAVVRAGARLRYRGSRIIEFASHSHGREGVLRAMVDAAREGLFGSEEARFLLYYVRPRRWGGDDKSSPETCRELVDELRRILPRV